jgi:hypothetical protein
MAGVPATPKLRATYLTRTDRRRTVDRMKSDKKNEIKIVTAKGEKKKIVFFYI